MTCAAERSSLCLPTRSAAVPVPPPLISPAIFAEYVMGGPSGQVPPPLPTALATPSLSASEAQQARRLQYGAESYKFGAQ